MSTEPASIDSIIAEISKSHNVTIGRDDPILILHTLNEQLLKRTAENQELQLKRFKEEFQLMISQLDNASKEKAEKIISSALTASRQTINSEMNTQIDIFNSSIRRSISDMKNEIISASSTEKAVITNMAKINLAASVITFLTVLVLCIFFR